MILKGKTAVITGCNKGIGKSTLETFAREGANVFACVRKENEKFSEFINELENKYSVKIIPIYFDLSNEEEISRGLKEIYSYKTPIDILVNNAGMVNPGRLFTMMSLKDMKALFQVNFFAQMQITQFIARIMMKQKFGSIVNLTSIAGIDGIPAELDYISSKAALIGATKRLAIELGGYNIRVNSIAPGIIETEIIKDMTDNFKEKRIENTILKRLGKPNEISEAIVWISSDKASYITGQTIRVDGGVI